jgi:hypothetical protein
MTTTRPDIVQLEQLAASLYKPYIVGSLPVSGQSSPVVEVSKLTHDVTKQEIKLFLYLISQYVIRAYRGVEI